LASSHGARSQTSYSSGVVGITGIVVPVLDAYRDDAIFNATVFPVFSAVAWKYLVSMAVGFIIAFGLRSYADHLLSQIKD
jgi:hypothetical protein